MAENYWGKNLKYLRKEKGISQAQLGLQVGRSHTAVSNWETGFNEPGLSDLLSLASFFEISVDDFLNVDLDSKGYYSKKTGKTPPIPIKTTNVLLIEDASLLTKMEEEIKQMRAEYDRRLANLENIILNPATLHIDNRMNEPEVVKKTKHA